jgi:hypothetical protein
VRLPEPMSSSLKLLSAPTPTTFVPSSDQAQFRTGPSKSMAALPSEFPCSFTGSRCQLAFLMFAIAGGHTLVDADLLVPRRHGKKVSRRRPLQVTDTVFRWAVERDIFGWIAGCVGGSSTCCAAKEASHSDVRESVANDGGAAISEPYSSI